MSSRPEKIRDLKRAISNALEKGEWIETQHALERMIERGITRLEYQNVLKHGYHERQKDEIDDLHQTWNYALRHRSFEERDLRVIIAFEREMLVITVIEIES